MLQTQIFGMISHSSLGTQDLVLSSFSTKISQQLTYENQADQNAPIFFKIQLHYYNPETISCLNNSSLCVICVGYSFHHANLATMIANSYLNQNIFAVRGIFGYYSFVIIDKINRQAYVGGDSAGTCPIYYYDDGQTLIFSNVLKNVILNFTTKSRFNFKVLFELFHLGMVTPPDTLVENIYSIPTTKYLSFTKKVELQDFIFLPPENIIFDEEVLYQSLKNAFSPMRDKSNIGVMCSGGLDSSFITTMLYQQGNHKLDLFTLYYDQHHSDVMNTTLLAKQYQAYNHYYKPENSGFIPAMYESLWLGESEAVGALSLNIRLEFLFSKFVSNFHNGVILTGDIYFTRIEQSPSINLYATKYGMVTNSYYNLLLKSNKNYGYLNFSQKYSGGAEYKNLLFPEVLGLKINGKIRMNINSLQKYYLPFVDSQYLQQIKNLIHSDKNFNYRLSIARLAKHRELLPKQILLTKKSWLPGWLENSNQDKLISAIINIFSNENSFCSSVFGNNINQIIYNDQHQKNYRLIIALFYLELFHENFIENPKNLISKEGFVAKNLENFVICENK